jgi:hypothetical protein
LASVHVTDENVEMGLDVLKRDCACRATAGDLFAGVKFQDELPANEVLPDDQQDTA